MENEQKQIVPDEVDLEDRIIRNAIRSRAKRTINSIVFRDRWLFGNEDKRLYGRHVVKRYLELLDQALKMPDVKDKLEDLPSIKDALDVVQVATARIIPKDPRKKNYAAEILNVIKKEQYSAVPKLPRPSNVPLIESVAYLIKSAMEHLVGEGKIKPVDERVLLARAEAKDLYSLFGTK